MWNIISMGSEHVLVVYFLYIECVRMERAVWLF